METFDTRDFLILEHLPSSSNALRQKLSSILLSSEQWRAIVEEVDPKTGSYRLVLEGTLRGNRA
ncbi:MAG TPA: hypothetical protein ENK07_05220 [Bacteroidetes bacterium]|nr:hypothetical protein [Bacteroidota bacterium]